MKTIKITFTAIILMSLFSCATVQPIETVEFVEAGDIEKNSFSEEIFTFERRFLRLDALFVEGKSAELLAECEKLCADCVNVANAYAKSSVQKSSLARLYAIEGSANLLLGKKTQAKSAYEKSDAAFKGDSRAAVLSVRLGLQKNPELFMTENSDNALLTLEKALELYKKGDFSESVACFDMAFIKLDSSYREFYGKLRDTAWKFRSVSSGDSVLKLQDSITVLQMLSLSNSESSLLEPYLFGKTVSDDELFTRISGSGLLNPVSEELSASNAVSKNDVVTKKICARFLWNIYCGRKDSLKKSAAKYSNAFRKSGREAPVADISVADADFDAVLGCVEKEIMNLEDGTSFRGDRKISAVEFTEALKKIR